MAKPIPPVPPDVAELLAKGHLLEAVKRLRASSPMGLAEAKKVIEWHVRHHALRPPSPGTPKASNAPAQHRAAPAAPVKVHVRHNPTVHAPRPPGLAPGEVAPSSGGGMGIVILLAAAFGLAYYFLR